MPNWLARRLCWPEMGWALTHHQARRLLISLDILLFKQGRGLLGSNNGRPIEPRGSVSQSCNTIGFEKERVEEAFGFAKSVCG